MGGSNISCIITNDTMTSGERAAILAYTAANGSAGEITLGPELVTNGNFASAAGWTLLGAATIAGGVGTTTSGGGWRTSVSLIANKPKLIMYDVVRYVGGTVTAALTGGTTVFGSAHNALGEYAEIVTSLTANTMLQLSTGGGSNLDIDNVSAREIILP
jgi:hypothetical protein